MRASTSSLSLLAEILGDEKVEESLKALEERDRVENGIHCDQKGSKW